MSSQLLLIDPDPKILEQLQWAAKLKKLSVETAKDGARALDQIRQSDIALVVCEPNSLGKDLLQFIEEAHRIRPSLRILALSEAETLSGFSAYDLPQLSLMQKPVHPVELRAMIDLTLLAQGHERKIAALTEEQVNLEKSHPQLVVSEKLASIGRLVGGMAHEINNPLTAVIGYAQLMIDNQFKDRPKERAQIIIREARRCEKIIQNLLDFARKRKLKRTRVNLCDLIDQTLQLIAGEIKKANVEVIRQYPVTPLEVEADANQLSQVFFHVLSNACQAMDGHPGGHRLTLTIAAKEVGGFYVLRVQDSGPGIDKKHIGKVFDPFFTTKDVGKGTGLGLSLVYGIIQGHGGSIEVESQAQQGAVFIIRLPATLGGSETKEEKNAIQNQPLESSPAGQKNESILLIEDDDTVRELLQTVIAAQGYQIEAAEDGEKALRKLIAADYDLIVCDFRLPKMNAQALYEKIIQTKAYLAPRFLFISGSADLGEGGAHHFFDKYWLTFLTKPFSGDDLLTAIDKHLQSLRLTKRSPAGSEQRAQGISNQRV